MYVAAVLLLAVLIPVLAQQTITTAQSSIQRDPQALDILAKSLAVLGSIGSYSSTSGVIARGHLMTATGGISGFILWENQGAEFRYERPGPNSSIVFVSGHGRPAIAAATESSPIPSLRACLPQAGGARNPSHAFASTQQKTAYLSHATSS